MNHQSEQDNIQNYTDEGLVYLANDLIKYCQPLHSH